MLPVVGVVATRVGGGDVSEAQAAFVLTGITALIVHQCHLAIVRRAMWDPQPRWSPVRAAGLYAAGCAALTTLLIPWPGGHVSRAAETASLGSGLLAVALVAPALPHAAGGARDVVWRLLIVAIAGAALTMPPSGPALAAVAVVWWLASWLRGGAATRGPTAAQVAAPVTVVSEASQDPALERRRLFEHRFGVVSRGCEHRLVDAASPRVAVLPADCRIDWWRVSEVVPVVNGAVAFAVIRPALDRHPRVLVQVEDVVVGVIHRDRLRAHHAEPVTAVSTGQAQEDL